MWISGVLAVIFFASVQAQPPVDAPRVAFRLDDIQDYYVVPAQIAVMEKFRAQNTPLSIGMIGGPTKFGDDQEIVSYVLNAVLNPDWEVEIVSHGNQHEDFSLLTFEQQVSLLDEANTRVKQLLTVAEITTFIPPFNEFNEFTIPALQSLGFTHMSSQVQIDTEKPYPLVGETFYRFPIAAATNDLGNNVFFSGIPALETFQQIQEQIAVDGFAAVMMHPMEHAERVNGEFTKGLNESQLGELEDLIQMVIDAGYEIVPLGRLNYDAPDITLTGPAGGYIPTIDCNCVAFTLDQVQDYYLTAGSIGVLNVFAAGKDDITLGIIAQYFGDDTTVVEPVQLALADPLWEVEIASNGNLYEAFGGLPLQNQSLLLQASSSVISAILGITPTTFVPPFDSFDDNTIQALKAEGFTHLSASIGTDPPPYNADPLNDLWRFPAGVSFGVGVLNQIMSQRNNLGFAVVSMSPESFMITDQGLPTEQVDPAKIAMLQQLLVDVKAAGLQIVTIGRINQNFSSTTGGNIPTTALSTTDAPSESTMGGTGTSSASSAATVPTTDDPTGPVTTQSSTEQTSATATGTSSPSQDDSLSKGSHLVISIMAVGSSILFLSLM